MSRAMRRRSARDEEPEREDAPANAPDAGVADLLLLQRSAGNAAVAQLLARAPAAKGTTGSVQIGGVGAIKVNGGTSRSGPAQMRRTRSRSLPSRASIPPSSRSSPPHEPRRTSR